MQRSEFLRLLLASAASASALPRLRSAQSESRKLVLIAGSPSHPPGMHEFRAGTLLLEKRLAQVPRLTVERHDGGWVEDESTLEDADAVVIYSDGGRRHPLADQRRLALVGKHIERGLGLGCMHYGVEVLPDDAGEEFKTWLGGFYEHEWSCNPIWTPSFDSFPDHPVANGVRPFAVEDEWYFNMRFRDGFDAASAKDVDGEVFTPIPCREAERRDSGRAVCLPEGPVSAHSSSQRARGGDALDARAQRWRPWIRVYWRALP